MTKPHIYIHRCATEAANWYPFYMNDANESSLRAWATVTSDGTRVTPLTVDELTARLSGVDGVLSLNGIGSQEITTDVLRSVGTVNVFSVSHWWHTNHNPARQAWEAAGATVIDASDVCTDAVVEWVIGTALMATRRLDEFNRRLHAGESWAEPGRRAAKMLGQSMIGLVGVGRIGRAVTAHFRAFGAQVIGYDPFLSADEAQSLGIRLAPLEEVLRTADIVSLHMAVSDATRRMIGTRELAWLKDGAILLNSARAALLDPDALVAALGENRFRAFLDVYDTEPLPLDDPLRALPNAFLTPHIAGDTNDMFLGCGRLAIERLREYFGA